MFEKKNQEIVSTRDFIKRTFIFFCVAILIILCSLFIGIAGYHWIADLAWVDALLNASMILGGMGPVDQLNTNAAKIFASMYALFSGLVFIVIMGLLFTPLLHRILHTFHADYDD